MTWRAEVQLLANAKWNDSISICEDNDTDDEEDEDVNITELWRPVTLPPQLFTGILHSDCVSMATQWHIPATSLFHGGHVEMFSLTR